jgi:hypothetical protein
MILQGSHRNYQLITPGRNAPTIMGMTFKMAQEMMTRTHRAHFQYAFGARTDI